jgi:hypothetical protein
MLSSGASACSTTLRLVLMRTSTSPSSVTIAWRMRRIVRRRSSSAALNCPTLVSSESSASASRRSTVSGVRRRWDRSATSSRSVLRAATSLSAMRLNA